jgi:hypothetical protein
MSNSSQENQLYNYEFNKIFKSLDNNHEIEISIIEEISWFNIIKFDLNHIKTFLILLKDVIIYMNQNKIKYVKQYIYKEDLEHIKKSSYIEYDSDKFVITTDLIDFIHEITNLLGIKKI